jgi:Ca2+-binding EF-hand superfamily protein
MINLSPEDRKRYQELFHRLDANSDGKIDVNDLVVLFDKNKPSKNEAEIADEEHSLRRAKVGEP